MTATDVALIAAGLSLVAVTLSAIIGSRAALRVTTRQHELVRAREEEAASLARRVEFFSQSHAAVVRLGPIAYANRRAALKALPIPIAEIDRFNSALAAVRIAEPLEVAAAALALDRALVRLNNDARDRRWTEGEWRERRSEVDRLALEFLETARPVSPGTNR